MIVDFLTCLWSYAKAQITNEIGSIVDLGTFSSISGAETDGMGRLGGRAAHCSRGVGRGGLLHHARGRDQGWSRPERTRR